MNKFNENSIKLNSKILIIGSEGYGSQSAARSIIYNNRNKYNNSLMLTSYDDNVNNLYSNMIPNLKVLKDTHGQPDYMGGDNWVKNKLHLEDFITNQKKRIRDQIFNTSTIDLEKDRCLIILNNINGQWFKSSKVIKSLFMEARQFNICLVILTHYSTGLSPEMRTSIDYIVMTQGQSSANQCKLYDHYGYIFDSYKTFASEYKTIGSKSPYTCMVISQVECSVNKEDIIFWWLPKQLNNLKFILIDE
jgi:hypothetical protein